MKKEKPRSLISKENVKNVRFLHLKKFAGMSGIRDCQNSNNANIEKRRGNRKEYNYNVMGHYDVLTYVRTEDFPVTYEHYFCIHYPYSKFENAAVVSEQFFTLLDLDDSIRAENDPFEYAMEEPEKEKVKTTPGAVLPFLGILLFSVEIPTGTESSIKYSISYDWIIQKIVDAMQERNFDRLKNGLNNRQAIIKVFLTLNCANLAIVVRTDTLADIYKVRSNVTQITLDIGDRVENGDGKSVRIKPEYVITPLICSQIVQYKDNKYQNPLEDSAVKKANREMHFNIRLGLKNHKNLNSHYRECGKFFQNQKGMEEIYAILGAGDYSITLEYNSYAEVYSWLCYRRFQFANQPDYVDGNTLNLCKTKDYLIREFCEDNIDHVYERLRFDRKDVIVESKVDTELYMKLCSMDLQKYIERSIKKLRSYRDKVGSFRNEYERNLTLMRDLSYTYDDLCHLSKFGIHGYIFVIQMKILVDSIQSFMENYKDVPCLSYAEASYLCDNMKTAILSINNYNKMLQIFNQYTINYQGYEIQSKVNTEKYLLAYTAFLQEICRNYTIDNKLSLIQDRNRKHIDIYPIVSMDLTLNKIETRQLFDYVDFRQQDDVILPDCSIFSVNFPDYRNFADIYHVLPILVHEISHSMRYVERKKRNITVINYVLSILSERMARFLLCAAHNTEQIEFVGGYTELISQVIHSLMFNKISSEEQFEDLNLKEEQDFFKEQIQKWFHIKQDFRESHFSVYEKSWMEIYANELKELCRYLDFRYYNLEEVKEITNSNRILKAEEILEVCYSIVSRLFLDTEEPGYEKIIEEWAVYVKFLQLESVRIYVNNCLTTNDSLNNQKEISNYGNFVRCLLELTMVVYQDIKDAPDKEEYKMFRDVLAAIFDVYSEEWQSEIIKGIGCGIIFSCLEQMKQKYGTIREVKTFFENEENIRGMLRSADSFECSVKWLWEDANGKDMNEKSAKERYLLHQMTTELLGMKERLGQIYHIAEIKKCNEMSMEKEFSEELHTQLYERFQPLYEKKEDIQFLQLCSQLNNRNFSCLGINVKNSEIFKTNFKRMAECYENDIMEIIEESFLVYEEIYADLGMCAAFKFSPFGYLRLFLHMHEKQFYEKNSNELRALYDRARVVILVLMLKNVNVLKDKSSGDTVRLQAVWDGIESLVLSISRYGASLSANITNWLKRIYKEEVEEGNEETESFICKFKEDSSRINKIDSQLQQIYSDRNQIKENEDGERKRELWVRETEVLVNRLLYWQKECYQSCSCILQARINFITDEREKNSQTKKLADLREYNYYLQQMSMIYQITKFTIHMYRLIAGNQENILTSYLKDMEEVYRMNICESRWVDECRKDVSMNAISSHYNNNKHEITFELGKSAIRKDGMYYQNKFIYNYYCKCKDSFGKLGYVTERSAIYQKEDSPEKFEEIDAILNDWIRKLRGVEVDKKLNKIM